MDQASEVADRVIDAAMALAAEQGWRHLPLSRIGAAAGVPLVELYRQFPNKAAVLSGLSRRIDAAVLAGGPCEEDDSVRDRIFDLLMRRFDGLNVYRQGVAAIVKDLPQDPEAALCQLMALKRSMHWTLDLAGDPPEGIVGQIKVRALAVVYLWVLRTWMQDDSADMAKTMAALDRRLNQAEQLAGTFRLGGRRWPSQAKEAEE